MAHLLFFIHSGEIWKGTIQPRLKNGTHFSCYESLPKGYNVQMSNAVVSDNPGGLSVQLPPPQKNWQPSENRLLAILVSVVDGK